MSLHFTAEGRDYLMNVALRGGAQIADWYVVMFEGDYTPQDDDTAANIGARATEITAYTESTRQALVLGAPVGGSSDNAASVAKFTLNATKSVRLFGIVSSAGKGSATGVLLAIQRLPSARTYGPGDEVKVPVPIAITNAP